MSLRVNMRKSLTRQLNSSNSSSTNFPVISSSSSTSIDAFRIQNASYRCKSVRNRNKRRKLTSVDSHISEFADEDIDILLKELETSKLSHGNPSTKPKKRECICKLISLSCIYTDFRLNFQASSRSRWMHRKFDGP